MSFLTEYVEILTDPAHMAVEATLMAVEAAVVTPVVLRARRRWRQTIRREHAAIDACHGVTHPGLTEADLKTALKAAGWTDIPLTPERTEAR